MQVQVSIPVQVCKCEYENFHGRYPNEKHFPLYKFSLKAEGGTNSVIRKCNPLRRSCVSSARNAGESAICPWRAQPSAEIVRVECAKCRRERDLSCARATLSRDRARRVREMQARARFILDAGNPLRRSCMSSARNAGESAICPTRRATFCGDRACRACEMQARDGESAICPVPAQPSAEIVRVERAKRRRECELSGSSLTLCGDRARRVPEKQARVRLVPRARVSGELEDKNWRLCSTTLVRGVLASWKMRTGDFVVQL